MKTQKEILEETLLKMDKLSPRSLNKLINEMAKKMSISSSELIEQLNDLHIEKLYEYYGYNMICPYCGNESYKKHGHDKKRRQIYKCDKCNKRFTATTNTLMDGSHYPVEIWISFIEYLVMQLKMEVIETKLKEQFSECGLNFNRKVLYAMRNKVFMVAHEIVLDDMLKNPLSNIVKLDEFYFKENQSGVMESNMFNAYEGRKGKRKARHSIEGMPYGIMTDDFANIMVCTDELGRCFSRMVRMGYTDMKSFKERIIPFIDVPNVEFMVTDSQDVFKTFCKENNIKHMIIYGENYNAKKKIGQKNSDGTLITEQSLYEDGQIGEFRLNKNDNFTYMDYSGFKTLQEAYDLNLDAINKTHGAMKDTINRHYKSVPTVHLEGYLSWICYLRNLKIKQETSIYTENTAKKIFVELLAFHRTVKDKELYGLKLKNFDRPKYSEFQKIKKKNRRLIAKYEDPQFKLHPEDKLINISPKEVIENMSMQQLRNFAKDCKVRVQYKKDEYKTREDLIKDILVQPDFNNKFEMFVKPNIISRKNSDFEKNYDNVVMTAEVKQFIDKNSPDVVAMSLSTSVPTMLPAKLQYHPERTYFVDLETTGTKEDDEVLSIAIINGFGTEIFYSLCKPENHTKWEEAEKINGISPDMVKDKPTFKEVMLSLEPVWKKGQEIISYNLEFELRFLKPFMKHQHFTKYRRHSKCCMIQYANEKNGGVWVSQESAMGMLGIQLPKDENLHNALTDAKICREIWLKLYPQYFDKKVIKAAKYGHT